MTVFREYRGFEIRRRKVGMKLVRCRSCSRNSKVGCRVALHRDFVGYVHRQLQRIVRRLRWDESGMDRF